MSQVFGYIVKDEQISVDPLGFENSTLPLKQLEL